jgi:guanylate kinase
MTADVERRGVLLVLSSPSGAGKSSLSRLLLQDEPQLTLSVSVTTRRRRPSEVEGVHYHFVDTEEFARLRDNDELLEWAEVHGHLYATPRAPVERALRQGRDMLFDIDWQGTQQMARAMPDDIVPIFVLPPSMKELRARLERRAEDDNDVIGRRLANARAEIEHWREYEYVVVNCDLQTALETAKIILAAERQRRGRRLALAAFVDSLLSEP